MVCTNLILPLDSDYGLLLSYVSGSILQSAKNFVDLSATKRSPYDINNIEGDKEVEKGFPLQEIKGADLFAVQVRSQLNLAFSLHVDKCNGFSVYVNQMKSHTSN